MPRAAFSPVVAHQRSRSQAETAQRSGNSPVRSKTPSAVSSSSWRLVEVWGTASFVSLADGSADPECDR